MRNHGNQMSDFQKNSLFLGNSFLAIICLNFTFSTILLVNNGHIKHVNRVQYCRAGHRSFLMNCITLRGFDTLDSINVIDIFPCYALMVTFKSIIILSIGLVK